MANKLQIPMTSAKGVLLKTQGKFCGDNIEVTPELEEIHITENGEYTPSKVGYSKVTVDVASGGGYIDVTELPKPWKLYFAHDGEIQDGEEFVKTFFSGIASVEFFYVDEFPVPMAISGNGISVLYVLKTDGVVYFSNDGITPIRFDDPSNLPLAVCHGLVDSVDDIDANVKGFYTQKGGEINEEAVYRLTEEEEAPPTLWLVGTDGTTEFNMPIVDYFKAMGVPVDLTITVVETLPETMPAVNEDTFTFPCYVLESTGIAYVSLDGTSATAIPVGAVLFGEAGFDKGWIDSADEIVIDPSGAPSIYTIRPGTQLVPKGLFVYSDGWYELEKTLETTEKPREPRVYATTSDGEVVDYAEESGYEIHFVDALPVENGWYVLNATGLMYYVDNGQANLFPGTQYGWVDSIEEIDTSKSNCLYALRGSKTDVIYKVGENGTTNEVYIHENDEWQGFVKGGGTPDTPESSGMELNIAYGDTAPEDTTKLWVKTSVPTDVIVSTEANYDHFDCGTPGEPITSLSRSYQFAVCKKVGNKIYVLSGHQGMSANWSNFITEFDVDTGEQTSTANTNLQVQGALGAVVGDKIYIISGTTSSTAGAMSSVTSLVKCYDTLEKTLTSLTNVSTGSIMGDCVAVGTKIYGFGGYRTNKNSYSYCSQVPVLCYDTETRNISELTEHEICSVNPTSCALVGGKSYVFEKSGKAYCFDIKTETVEHIDYDSSNCIGCVAVGSTICVVKAVRDASDGSGYYALKCSLFDTETYKVSDEITVCRVQSGGRQILEAAGNKIFLGATPGYNNTPVYYWDLNIGNIQVPKDNLYILANNNNNMFNLTDEMNVGIRRVYKGNADGIGVPVEAAIFKDGAWVTI